MLLLFVTWKWNKCLLSYSLLSFNFKTNSCCPIRISWAHPPTSPCTSSAPDPISQPLRLVWDSCWLNCQLLRSIQNIVVTCMGRSLICHFTLLLTYKPHFSLGLQDRIQRTEANSKPLSPLNAAIMCYLKHTEQVMTWNLISLQGTIHYSLKGKGPNNISMCTAIVFPRKTIPPKPAGQLHRVKFHMLFAVSGPN